MTRKRIFFTLALSILIVGIIRAENGYELWLRYPKIENASVYRQYQNTIKQIIFPGNSSTLRAAQYELKLALKGLLNLTPSFVEKVSIAGTLVIGTPQSSSIINTLALKDKLSGTGNEGFIIQSTQVNGKACIVIAANTDIGVLYGVFNFLKKLQMHQDVNATNIIETPKLKYRLLNHWDNLNGTIERGYAGYSLWDWQRLPGYIDARYIDYARANASIGINGAVLNNVNANARSLTREYLIKLAALADVFRPYGIKIYLTARFSAPIEIGRMKTADPLSPEVRQWWKDKAKEIYEYIPDFGGFLVKANSEGQPGPQDYQRTHADGANMLGEALEPFGGIVMWRTFVYHNARHIDRVRNGYDEFKKFDGTFRKNVFLQPKNGPIDFQPREPFNPLFGSMPATPLMIEFQLTQEYLGYATNLVYLAPLIKECLDSDTYTTGKGSTVAKVLENYNVTHGISGMAGVSNIGSDINWTGHVFGQANWFAYGQLTWNSNRTSEEIADEWLRMTFSNDKNFITPIKKMMLTSRETAVKFRTPIGLNHIMNFATHYGPGPWYKDNNWDAKDYHKADSIGLGVDRTATGSNAVEQYAKELHEQFANIKTCPEKYLLWFHHVPWNYSLSSGRTLWNELVFQYYKGVEEVKDMRKTWDSIKDKIDATRYEHVKQLLVMQEDEAIWWRDGCVLYFQSFSKLPIAAEHEKPAHDLSYYKRIPFPFNWEDQK
jgi:alpha-glucuronidase